MRFLITSMKMQATYKDKLQDNDWFKRAVIICFLGIIALTYKVFIGRSFLSHVPINSRFVVPEEVHVALFGVLVMLLIAMFALPKKDFLGYLILMAFAALCVIDINRAQPYNLCFLVLLLIPHESSKNARAFVAIVTMATTYICAGINKLNPDFGTITAPYIYTWLTGGRKHELLDQILSVTVPIMDLLIGVSLLIPFMKRFGHKLAFLMHAGIITVMIMTRGEEVIFWSVLYILINFIFYEISIYKFDVAKELSNVIITLAFIVIPILGFAGKVNYMFTFPLYTGKDMLAIIIVSEDTMNRMEGPMKQYIKQTGTDYVLNVSLMAAEELHIGMFPVQETFKSVARDVAPFAKSDRDMILVVSQGSSAVMHETLWLYSIKDL